MKTQASCCQDLRIIPIPLDDEIKSGDSVTDKILGGMKDQNLAFIAGDILVVKHKIVSKAEGQIVDLAKIRPSAASRAWARHYRLDAREAADGLIFAKSTIWPSALDTILCFTTKM